MKGLSPPVGPKVNFLRRHLDIDDGTKLFVPTGTSEHEQADETWECADAAQLRRQSDIDKRILFLPKQLRFAQN